MTRMFADNMSGKYQGKNRCLSDGDCSCLLAWPMKPLNAQLYVLLRIDSSHVGSL